MKNLHWIANYTGGSKTPQFEKGKENLYEDIDRELLFRFDMVDPKTNKPVYSLYLSDGKRLIFRRRTFKKFGKPDVIVFLVGYVQTFMTNVGSKSVVVLNYIHADGTISLDDARHNLELLEFEKSR